MSTCARRIPQHVPSERVRARRTKTDASARARSRPAGEGVPTFAGPDSSSLSSPTRTFEVPPPNASTASHIAISRSAQKPSGEKTAGTRNGVPSLTPRAAPVAARSGTETSSDAMSVASRAPSASSSSRALMATPSPPPRSQPKSTRAAVAPTRASPSNGAHAKSTSSAAARAPLPPIHKTDSTHVCKRETPASRASGASDATAHRRAGSV